MNPRERLLKILNHETPDFVPWFGDLDYYATALITKKEKPDNFKISDDYLEWHRRLRVGFYLQGYFPFTIKYKNCEEKNYSDGNLQYHELITPVGVLRECYEYMPLSYTKALLEHLVKKESDLKILNYAYNDAYFEPDFEQALTRKKQIRDDGIVLVYAPKTPFMQLMVYDIGLMNLTELLMDYPEQIEETLIIMKGSFDRAMEVVLKTPCDAVMIPENLSSEMVGKSFFEKYMRDVQVEWIGKIKAASKYSFIHMDGSLRGLLKEECSTGLNVLEALTPLPVGDVDITEFSSFASGSETILWGGLPGSYFTPMISDTEFENHVRNVLEIMTSEPRYVLGVADQVPPDGMESRIAKVAELVECYGKFK
jgi:hypothetical protein